MAAAFLAAGLAAPVEAAHPLLTEDTGTQGRGKAQFELMVDRTRDHPPGARVSELLTTAVLSYGVFDNADLQLGLPYLRRHIHDSAGHQANRGPSDVSVDFKWRFFQDEALSFGFKPGITLPSGDERRGLGSGRTTWGGLLVLSYEPGPWAFHAHAGHRRNRNALEQRASLRHLSGALTWQATGQVRLVADLSADTDPDRDRRGSLRYRIVGLVWSPTPALDFDAGLKRGHGQAAADSAVLFGLTFRW